MARFGSFPRTNEELLANPPDVAREIEGEWPQQGAWSEDEFLKLDRSRRRLIEFTDGVIEILPYPTISHQRILGKALVAFSDFIHRRHLGIVIMAPCPVRLRPGLYRDPDVFLCKSGRKLWKEQPDGAELVMEIVAPDPESRHRDYVRKARDYADAGIPEYWIVDEEERRVTVLTLKAGEYLRHASFHAGESASGVLFPDFQLSLAELFQAD